MIKLFLDSDFAVFCTTLLLGFVTACFTYRGTKKLKYFEIFFKSKVDAYENFITSVLELFNNKDDNILKVVKSYYLARLYCSKEALSDLDKIVHLSPNITKVRINEEDLEALEIAFDNAIPIFRRDLQKCRKFRFD